MKKFIMTMVLMPMMALASLTDGLVAYYPFDGNANDASGNGNHGTIHGVTLTTDRFGNANGAYYFGDGNYISVEDSVSLDSPSNQITVTTWVRIDEWYWMYNPFAAILNKGGARQYSFNLWGYAGEAGTEIGHDLHAMFEVLPEMGEWCHLAVTYSDGCAYAYLNGNLVGTFECVGQFIAESAALEIGRDTPGLVEYLYGALDDLRIYNRALSAAEVKALYDGTAVTPTSVLLHRWSFNGSLDDSVGGNTAVSVGSGGGGYSWTSDGKSISLTGGSHGTSGIDLGANLLPTDGSPITLEFWTKNRTQRWWSRVFDVGYSSGGQGSAFLLAWNYASRTYPSLHAHDAINNSFVEYFDNVLSSFNLNCDYHISVVVEPNRDGDGRTVFTVSKRDAMTGTLIDSSVNKTSDEWSVANLTQSEFYLGRSHWTADSDASCDYDEVRIWNAALTSEQLATNVLLGPDMLPPDLTGGNTCTVTFDLNGAEGDAPAQRQVADGAAVGELPTVNRTGYTLAGWFTAASGGEQVTASTTVTGDVTCYAHWTVNRYTAMFNANGGEGGTTRTLDYGTALAAPTVTRTGYTFTGWSPSVPSTVPASDTTYYAQWRINQYTATFDANGGEGGTAMTQDYGTTLTAPTVTRTGYTFTGWSPSVPSAMPAESRTYTAQWRINSYTVTFDAQGGAGGGTVARNHGAALGEMPVPTRDGFSFDGWFAAADGGAAVSADTIITGPVTFYAHWTEVALYPTPVWYGEDGEEVDWSRYYDGDEEPFAAESAATFDGYVLDGEEVCGFVQVKVGKANRKTETAKVTAALTLLGEAKKLSYKGTMSKRGVAELTCAGKANLSLCLGTNAMWGEVDGKTVSGARNVFAKAGDPKAAALSRWQGTYALVLETTDATGSGSAFAWGYSGLTLTVGAKGKVKVQGTMVDGAKVSVAAQLLVGEKRCCVPVVVPLYSKKGGFGLNLWLQEDGEIEVGEMGAWDATASKTPFRAWFGENVPAARTGAALPGTLSFLFMGEPEFADAEVLYDFVPWEVMVTTGAKWTLPAAGNVRYDRESEEYVDAKDSANPAGLKLTYVAKTGAFKGSFKLYAVDSAGRLKKLTANVSGVMVGRQGYGTATVKGVGSWPVAIE